MATLKGLDGLARKMKELERALAALDGDITKVGFDPYDPQSIDLAIQKMESAIDERVGGAGGNGMIDKLVEQAKERFRTAIVQRAAAARASSLAEGEA